MVDQSAVSGARLGVWFATGCMVSDWVYGLRGKRKVKMKVSDVLWRL